MELDSDIMELDNNNMDIENFNDEPHSESIENVNNDYIHYENIIKNYIRCMKTTDDNNPFLDKNYTIYDAILTNNLYMVIYFCEKKYNLNEKYNGYTPLYVACIKKKYDVARILLKYGADPNISVARHDVLNYVCLSRDHKMLRILLNCPNININNIDQYEMITPFEYVLKKYDILCINEFINKYFDVSIIIDNSDPNYLRNVSNKNSSDEKTGLLGELIRNVEYIQPIINNKNTELLCKLIVLGLDVTNKNKNTEPLIFKIYKAKWYDGIDILFKAGCDINVELYKNYNYLSFSNMIKNNVNKIKIYIDMYSTIVENIGDHNYNQCRCYNCNNLNRMLEKWNFNEFVCDKIKLYKKSWSPNKQYLYPLATQSIINWLLIRNRLYKCEIVYFPPEINFVIIQCIVNSYYNLHGFQSIDLE